MDFVHGLRPRDPCDGMLRLDGGGWARARGVVAAAMLAMAALAIGAAPAGAAAAQPEYVLVNANADGDTPVSGGLVRVHRCRPGVGTVASGRPLRQRNGSLGERTPPTGVTLLEFAQLPHCYVVSVTGGRAGARRLDGSFISATRNGSGRLENVSVTPISTLVHRYMQVRPGVGPAARPAARPAPSADPVLLRPVRPAVG